MRPLVALLAAVALAGCRNAPHAAKEPPRGRAVKETRSRALRRIRDSELTPKLKRELEQAQKLLDRAPD